MNLRPGETIDAYRNLGPLGSGGSGTVYKVEHSITGRVEAMKVLHRGYLESPAEEQRFLREIRLHAVLNHPNIVSVHNALRVGDDLLMIMEYVEGESLATIIERGRLPILEALDLIGQALTALEFAHAYEITHRDITPSNLLVTPEGLVKLMDFGLALQQTAPRLTQAGAPVGSYAYMSPEQVRAEPVDYRTDIYSVGAVLFELVTGKKPFECETAYALMRAHTTEAPPVPSSIEPGLPAAIDRLILRALEKEPELRYPSATDFKHALQAAIGEVQRSPKAVEAEAEQEKAGLSPTVKFLLMLAASFAVFIVVGVVSLYTTSAPAGQAAGVAAAVPASDELQEEDEAAPLPVFEPPPFAAGRPKAAETNEEVPKGTRPGGRRAARAGTKASSGQ